jgi:hypothetical protein
MNMKIRTLGWLVGLSAMASSFISCSQAKVECTAAHAGSFVPYFVQYFPQSPPACAAMTTTPGPITALFDPQPVTLDKMTVDWIGTETYHPQRMLNDEVQPDFSKGTIAIQSDTLGNLQHSWEPDYVDPDPNLKPYSIGEFADHQPDDNDFCKIPSFSAQTEQKFGMIPGVAPDPMDPMDPGVECVPGVDVKYEWSNMQIYVTAGSQGTQFTADLKYTQVDHPLDIPDPMMPDVCNALPDQTCSVTYKVRGFWPQVFCGIEVPDPTDPMMEATMFIPDDEHCCPDPSPEQEKGRPVGSGINPDFPTKCDPVLLTCVLDAPDDAKLPILGGSKLDICKKLADAAK